MQYLPIELMRGVWGLEDRLYTADEIAQSFHLQSARNAGAFVALSEGESAEVSTDTPQVKTIDLRDGVNRDESAIAARTLRQRRKEKEG